ncbi:iron ABC transporter permease [Raoultibacter timonensis]|uniref:Iron ABC transporter permease n=1 Tax=Raoultibacter timonensis TaxID=1907662 RepID=A0ABM7WMY9_9ACTN|nr:iron ABC transporter permease [Raoultibacter timonensis]BDF52414.1 iron ABC transporter permease [Raoultibacter timonensis]
MLSANRCGMCSVRHKVLLRFVEGRFAQDGNAATGREMSLGIVKKHSGGRGGFKGAPIIAILTIILVAAVLVSFTLGRYDMTVLDVLKVAANQLFGMETFSESTHITVVTQVRFPRVIAALVIGATLAAAGASYQGLFKNPMVSPDLLGASAGAGFGASFALLMGGNMYVVQLSAFVCGIVAVLLTYFVSTAVSKGDSMTLTLVLTGMVVTALFQAFITMTKYVADPDDKLPSITYWLMGGLSSTRIEDLPMLLAPVIVGIVPMLLFRNQLNALSFGDEEARALGVNTKFIRALFIFCATLVTAASVAAAGMVGWVGLVIPHLARMIVGPNHKVLLPASLLLGALYVLVIDDLCRCLFAIELPLSVLTAIIGAPFFIYLLTRGKKTWT